MGAATCFFILMDTDPTAENHWDFHNSAKQWGGDAAAQYGHVK
jgi:hypothetical protein